MRAEDSRIGPWYQQFKRLGSKKWGRPLPETTKIYLLPFRVGDPELDRQIG